MPPACQPRRPASIRRRILYAASRAFLACCLASAAPAAMAAGVHKCIDAGGRVLYSGVPCFPSQPAAAAPLPPLNVVTGGASPSADSGRSAARARPPAAAADRRGAMAMPARASRPVANGAARHTDRQVGERRFVSIGMTDVEVIARLGQPDRTLRGSLSVRGGRSARPAVSRWVYLPAAGDSDTITVVEIDGGAVVDVERRLQR